MKLTEILNEANVTPPTKSSRHPFQAKLLRYLGGVEPGSGLRPLEFYIFYNKKLVGSGKDDARGGSPTIWWDEVPQKERDDMEKLFLKWAKSLPEAPSDKWALMDHGVATMLDDSGL